MGGFSTLPVGSAPNKIRNPILLEIDNAAANAHATLSPQAQEVVRRTTAAPVPGPGNTMDRSPVEQMPMQMPAQPIAGPSGTPRPIGGPPPTDGVPTAPAASVAPTPPPAQPIASPAQTRLNALQAPVEHKHNKFLRGLGYAGDALLTTFAPRAAQVIPGTMLNKQLKLANAENAVTDEQNVLNDQSKRGLEGSQAANLDAQAAENKVQTEDLIPAQATEARARAWSLMNPKEKEEALNEFRLWHQQNPDAPVSEYLKMEAQLKAKPASDSSGSVHTDDQGNMWVVKPDGSAIPVTPRGQQPTPEVAGTPASLPVGTPPSPTRNPVQVETPPPAAPPKQLKAKPDKPTTEQSTTDIRNYEYAKSQGYKKSFEQWQTEDANRKRQQIAITTGGLTNPQSARVMQIANQFDGEPNVKRFNTIQEAQSLVSRLGTGAGANSTDDQALVYAFAKAMDPDSVVREGEYNTVQKYAQSWAESLGFNAQRIFSNTPFLTDQARRQMKDTITKKFAASQANYDRTFNEYGRRIEVQAGVPKGTQYLIDYRLGGGASPSGSAPVKIGSRAEYDRLPSGASYIDTDGNTYTKK